VAAAWTFYCNEFLHAVFGVRLPEAICRDPISTHGATWLNLPAALVVGACTVVLVWGIRESAASNTGLVLLKLGVVLFVILVGAAFVTPANWTDIPAEARKHPAQLAIPKAAAAAAEAEAERSPPAGVDGVARVKWQEERADALRRQALALYYAGKAAEHTTSAYWAETLEQHRTDLPRTEADAAAARDVLARAEAKVPDIALERWGMIAQLGIDKSLERVDDATRSNFMPYGFSGIMLGASLVFFAFIGFDSISTHSEEAIRPQRDVPFGILASLVVCTVLYIAVSAVITGMIPYPQIDTEAAIAAAFTREGERTGSALLRASAGLISAGALAGMTSVLLISFLSQARVFLAMARDGLLPHAIFGKVHDKYRTPHVSTIFMGAVMAAVAAFTPIEDLEKMVNIGTLFAFVVVCAAVLILRIKRPDAPRPFRTPLVYVVAPLGILVNVALMLFLPVQTWGRLVIWLAIGLAFYFCFGYRYSALRHRNGAEA
jgi:APA family basic amino acid/polyamine antiporter